MVWCITIWSGFFLSDYNYYNYFFYATLLSLIIYLSIYLLYYWFQFQKLLNTFTDLWFHHHHHCLFYCFLFFSSTNCVCLFTFQSIQSLICLFSSKFSFLHLHSFSSFYFVKVLTESIQILLQNIIVSMFAVWSNDDDDHQSPWIDLSVKVFTFSSIS